MDQRVTQEQQLLLRNAPDVWYPLRDKGAREGAPVIADIFKGTNVPVPEVLQVQAKGRAPSLKKLRKTLGPSVPIAHRRYHVDNTDWMY